MSRIALTRTLALLLAFALMAPATFFIAPQRVSADSSGLGCITGFAAGLTSLFAEDTVSVPAVSDTNTVGSLTTAGASFDDCVNTLILIPIAKTVIRNLLKAATTATINWINGANGTGQPSFVPNLSVHLQAVGDSAALSFIAKTATAFNSPFGPAISSALQRNYAQQTSLAGFYAANQCTLNQSSPNINAFLAGNWAQGGGVSTWLNLTTVPQNNPYELYQIANGQVGSNVSQATTNRRQDLIQSKGFLSYCGGDTSVKKVSASVSGSSINPQVSCMNANGTPANAVTPGSTIASYLETNVNSGIGQLVSAQDLDSAIGAVVTALANKVLGPTGLFGASQSSSVTNTTRVIALPSSAATASQTLSQTTLSNIATYSNAWGTIAAAANRASASVTALQNSCPTLTSAVQSALTTEIMPVLAKAQEASGTVAAAQPLALKVQAEAAVNPIADPIQFSTDVATLSSMPPASIDLVTAQSSAAVTGGSVASPVGSLTVARGTLVDQMNLISANANTMRPSCNIPGTVVTPDAQPFQGPGG